MDEEEYLAELLEAGFVEEPEPPTPPVEDDFFNVDSTTGNVGIGTSVPINARFHIVANDPYTTVRILQKGTGDVLLIDNKDIADQNDPPQTPYLNIKNDGRIGVGTTVPLAEFHLVTEKEGDILLGGVIGTGPLVSPTDSGIFFSGLGNTVSSGLFTEVDGLLVDLAANVEQVGVVDTSRVGGIIRLDTRKEGEYSTDLGDYNSFTLKGYPIGLGTTGEYNVLTANLDTADIHIAPVKGEVYVGAYSSTTSVGIATTAIDEQYRLYVNGNTGIAGTLSLPDYSKITLGISSRLELYHDPASGNSYLIESNVVGNLVIAGDDIEFKNAGLAETYAYFRTNGAVELYYDNERKFETNLEGILIGSIGISTVGIISGPSEIVLDPTTVGDNTGIVRIKGDLFVEGETTQINSNVVTIADIRIGIASGISTDNRLLQDAGIEIGIGTVQKRLTYNYNSDSLKSSENFDLAENKVYKIEGNSVLSISTVGSSVTTSSLQKLGTLIDLTVAGVTSTQDLYVVGFATINQLSATQFGSENISVGVATIGFASITAARIGIATIGFSSIGYSTIRSASVGISTIGFSRIGYSTITALDVGIATIGYSTITSVDVGIATIGFATIGFSSVGYSTITSVDVGIATIGFATIGFSSVGYSTISYADIGVSTITTLYTSAISAPGGEGISANIGFATIVAASIGFATIGFSSVGYSTITASDIGFSTITNLNVLGVSTFKDKVIFDSTNSIQIPVGTNAQRDSSPVVGQIRYNSEISSFEGYGPGNAWGSLGGVKDVDGNTYIVAETSPGANENTLFFYANGFEVATLSQTQFDLNVSLNVDADAELNGVNITGVATVGYTTIKAANIGVATIGSVGITTANVDRAIIGYSTITAIEGVGVATIGYSTITAANIGFATITTAEITALSLDNLILGPNDGLPYGQVGIITANAIALPQLNPLSGLYQRNPNNIGTQDYVLSATGDTVFNATGIGLTWKPLPTVDLVSIGGTSGLVVKSANDINNASNGVISSTDKATVRFSVYPIFQGQAPENDVAQQLYLSETDLVFDLSGSTGTGQLKVRRFSAGGTNNSAIRLGVTGDTTIDTGSGNLNINSIAGSSVAIQTNTSISGNVTLGISGAATPNTISFNGRFDTNLLPSTSSTRDLGSSTLRWNNFYCGAIDASSAAINNVTINNVRVGSSVTTIDTANATDLTITTLNNSNTVNIHSNLKLGLSNSNTINVVGRFSSTLLPSVDASGSSGYDLGSTAFTWKDIYATTIYTTSTARFNNVQISATNSNEIDTASGDLRINSNAGTVVIDDRLRITGITTVESNVYATGQIYTEATVGGTGLNVRSIPQATLSNGNLTAADVGKFRIFTGTGGNTASKTMTVVTGVFNIGDAVTVVNRRNDSVFIDQGSGVTLVTSGSGTLGNKTLSPDGVATILCVSSSTFMVIGNV